MKKAVCLLLVVSFLTIVVPAADAAVITQTKDFDGIPNMTGSLNFNQFNNSGGLTLQSIEVSLALQTSGGNLKLDNDSTSPASGTFEFGAKGNLSSTDVVLLNSLFSPVPGEVSAIYSQVFNLAANVGDGPGDYDPTPPDGLLYCGGTINKSLSGYVTSPVWYAGTKGFVGTGTYNISYTVYQWLDYGSIGGIEYAAIPGSVNGNVTVVYNYIPEPTTLLLLGLGAVMLRRKTA